ncbi:MAG TPA: hypothetical protein VMY69_02270 [Phycisphaerae bacterium]|nr:hypothetical protein [Phycisphaerae bacterium]
MVLPETVDRVVVVSGGPSAGKTWLSHLKHEMVPICHADALTIGANHMVESAFFDYWVTCDHMVFETANPRGRPILFGKNDWHQRITEGPQLEAWRAWPKIFQDDVHRLMPPPAGDVPTYTGTAFPCAHWNKFSGVAALGLAWILRPKEVDLFGFDMEGEGGAADEGHDLPRNRKAERWATEKRIFVWWLRAFAAWGIKVCWHTRDGPGVWPLGWEPEKMTVGQQGIS